MVDGRHRGGPLDGMVWGERSKDDFNMLAELQKVRWRNDASTIAYRLSFRRSTIRAGNTHFHAELRNCLGATLLQDEAGLFCAAICQAKE